MSTPIDPKTLRDWSGLARSTPAELHRPHDTEDVAAVVRRCGREGRQASVQDGLTSLAGDALPRR